MRHVNTLLFELAGLLQKYIIRSILLNDVRANDACLCAIAVESDACEEGAAVRSAVILLIDNTIALLEVEQAMALFFLPEPGLHHQLRLDLRSMAVELVVEGRPQSTVLRPWINLVIIRILPLLVRRICLVQVHMLVWRLRQVRPEAVAHLWLLLLLLFAICDLLVLWTSPFLSLFGLNFLAPIY